MPTALLLTLRPHEPVTVAPYLGRASHAALLRAVAERDAGLAQRLHDLDTLKPFAASDLLDTPMGRDGRSVQPDRTYGLRWSGLSPELDECLRASASAPPSEIELDGVRFAVERATIDPAIDPLAGMADWSDLVALEQVGRVSPAHRFGLHFLAPTTFRSNGRNIPLPLPELVFGSLLERWNSVAPITLPPEVRRFAGECLVISRYDLRSTKIASFGGGETAFTGRCTFTATNRDRYYLHCCAALLRLAFFSGVGAKTSMGFGVVRSEELRTKNQELRTED
jgi:CRISPR-associated endoribonuclease Cas6